MPSPVPDLTLEDWSVWAPSGARGVEMCQCAWPILCPDGRTRDYVHHILSNRRYEVARTTYVVNFESRV